MAILETNIKLLKSQVMDDVPEGGGRSTGVAIADGASNAIFPDTSELDRAYGRVNTRKVFVNIDTSDVDGYYGANVIVADPPDDPRVSCTLFSTGDGFDRRTDAVSAIESYLAQGSAFNGQLFGNHIAGQMTVTAIRRPDSQLPAVGETIVLRTGEGLVSQFDQYVRISDVSSSLYTFTDVNGDFIREIVVMTITDQLQQNFPGFSTAYRIDASYVMTGMTRLYKTIVADAARYYSAMPLAVSAAVGDYGVRASSIFSQLVPSTQIETPIADARMNQQSATLVTGGADQSIVIASVFTSASALYIGSSVMPGSLSVVAGAVSLTDKGGTLLQGTTVVGAVDYGNGLLTLSTNVFGGGTVAFTISFTPAAPATIVTNSIGVPVTAGTRRLSWVVPLNPAPVAATLQVSYSAMGRWYALNEDGTGAIYGADTSFGAGSLNFSTGTVSLTLGALPDAGTEIILSWVAAALAPTISQLPLPIDTPVPFHHTFSLGAPIVAGTLSISWPSGKVAVDDDGALSGDAAGSVNYATGDIKIVPNALPVPGTVFTIAGTKVTSSAGTIASRRDTAFNFSSSSGTHWIYSGDGSITANTLYLGIAVSYPLRTFPGVDTTFHSTVLVRDDGSGNLYTKDSIGGSVAVGTVNYTTGAINILKSIPGWSNWQGNWQDVTITPGGGVTPYNYVSMLPDTVRVNTLTVNASDSAHYPSTDGGWPWWSASSHYVEASYQVGASGSSNTTAAFSEAVAISEYFFPYLPAAFSLGASRYTFAAPNYIRDVSATTGNGTASGTQGVVGGISGVVLTSWPTGVAPMPTNVVGAAPSETSGPTTSMVTDTITFRTAVSPLFNGGFSISGKWKDDADFTVTPDADGIINTAGAGVRGIVGRVNYASGIITLRFCELSSSVGSPGYSNLSYLGIDGVTGTMSVPVQSDSLRYNAVGYSYIPLDADILGLNPVRLPNDGKVPVFRRGSIAVIHNTINKAPQTVANGQTVDVGRVRLSRLRVIGNDGVTISTGYTTDLDAGTVSFTSITGYSQPIHIEHRIEDMALVSDAQISGNLTFTRPLTHDFPLGSYVSSALIIGDMHARVSALYDQATWTGVWSDDLIGSAATGTFNDVLAPIAVTNKGAITERWYVIFTNTTAFNVVGEHVGVIATGNTSTDCAPTNPAASVPYFSIPATGWGSGWATGNVVRFNTVGALYPVWIARTILQGPSTAANDSFTIQIRGDIDNP